MNGLKIFYISFLLAVVSALTYVGCSEPVSDLANNPAASGVHPDGWSDPSSTSFHGKYIEGNKWDLNGCKTCHGADYRGGNTGSSCYTCHSDEGGPENCATCHGGNGKGNPPKALNGETSTSYIGVGAHTTHLDTTMWSAKVQCNECHVDFTSFSDTAHIGPNPDGIAEVVFGPLSRTSRAGVVPNPVWNRNDAKCSNSYCHGTFKIGNRDAQPVWTNNATVNCGSCHGNPATQNPNPRVNGNYVSPHFSYWTVNDCYLCHNQVMDASGQFVDKSKHVNGEINLNR